jgi:hypothetical protein
MSSPSLDSRTTIYTHRSVQNRIQETRHLLEISGQQGQIWVQRPVGAAYDAEYIRPKIAHPPRISLWGMFSSRGVGDIHMLVCC